MKIALVDDESSQLQHLNALLARELDVLGCHTPYKIDTYQNARLFLEQWTAGSYDVIILDIFMGSITGMDVAAHIRMTDDCVKLVFCSQSNDFAAESYQLNAQYYLTKPATQESISNMLKRLNPDQIQQNQTCTLPDGHTIIQRQILYTEYHNHVISIHLKGGRNPPSSGKPFRSGGIAGLLRLYLQSQQGNFDQFSRSYKNAGYQCSDV